MDHVFSKKTYREITTANIVAPIKVNDNLYILDEVNSIRMYLLIGSRQAALIDTGYGFSDFRHLIKAITDRPLLVINTHGHDDHVLGNYLFDRIYISREDHALCLASDNSKTRNQQILSRYEKTPNIEEVVDRDTYMAATIQTCEYHFIEEGDRFDLGGLTLQVHSIPGHTRGSIALYCQELRALFTGDAMMCNHPLVYAHALETAAAPQCYMAALEQLQELAIESVWPAHGDVPAGKNLIEATRRLLLHWAHEADATRDQSRQMSVFGSGQVFNYRGNTLIYHPGHLEEIRTYLYDHPDRWAII